MNLENVHHKQRYPGVHKQAYLDLTEDLVSLRLLVVEQREQLDRLCFSESGLRTGLHKQTYGDRFLPLRSTRTPTRQQRVPEGDLSFD